MARSIKLSLRKHTSRTLPQLSDGYQSVCLPCHLDPTINAKHVTLKWFKETKCIYLYRGGLVTEAAGYEHKLSVLPQDLEMGNVSLCLRDIQNTDAGIYIAQIINQGEMLETAVGLGVSNAEDYLRSETLTNKSLRMESANLLENKKSHPLIIMEPRRLDKPLQEEKNNLEVKSICICQVLPPEPSGVSELRLVLLGNSGAGKTAAANILLDREEDEDQVSPAQAPHSRRREGDVRGRRLALVDTVDWFSPDVSPEELRQDLGRCARLSAPGPHAFLLVLPAEPSEGEEGRAVEVMEQMLGEGCWGHTIILFTHTGSTRGQKMDAQSQGMQTLLEKCMHSYFILNIKRRTRNMQVPKLLSQIEEMVTVNKESFYRSQTYQEAQARETRCVCGEREERKRRKAKEKKKLDTHEMCMMLLQK